MIALLLLNPGVGVAARASLLGAHAGSRSAPTAHGRAARRPIEVEPNRVLIPGTDGNDDVRLKNAGSNGALDDKSPRHLLQYTGAVVAGSQAIPTNSPLSYPSDGYKDTAYAPRPAVDALSSAMATGQAPSDVFVRARGWLHGKIMGQRVDASGVATADIGRNPYGGVTGVAHASGQFSTNGPFGYARGQGQASAGVVTMQEQTNNGDTVMHGAAAAQASGSIYGGLPTGARFYGRGSATAQAEGTFTYTAGPIEKTSLPG